MSDFIDLFHDSMCALSVMRRGRLTLCTSAAFAKACLKREDRNSTPRSLCTTVPGGGFRWRTAARSARRVSCADFSAPSAQPSRRRECRSITVARLTPRAGDFQIRHIRHPYLIDAIHRHRMDLVVDAGKEAIEARCAPIQGGRAGLQRMLTHQPLDPAATHSLALLAQFGVHARATIGFPTVAVHPTDPIHQACILLRAFADRAIAPGVVAAGADTEQAAKHSHRDGFLLLLDEGKAFAFRAEVNAIAFFKTACSSFSCS